MADEPRNLPHVMIAAEGRSELFRPPSGGSTKEPSWVPNRQAHADLLLAQVSDALEAANIDMTRRRAASPDAENGFYLEVAGRPGEPLLTDKLESLRPRVELLTVATDQDRITATLFVPERSRDFLQKKIEKYQDPDKDTPKGNPANRPLVDGIASVRIARLSELWIDTVDRFPAANEVADWEVWLRPGSEERFRAAAGHLGLSVSQYMLSFPENTVLRVTANTDQMGMLVDDTLSASQLRRVSTTAEFFASMPTDEQLQWSDELLNRLRGGAENTPKICLLDTGVNRTHPLLEQFIDHDDVLAYDAAWEEDDHHGHGTNLAGISLFGDLTEPLESMENIVVPHRAMSVKIHPPGAAQNSHDLLGTITAGGIAISEIADPISPKVFCLATTTEDDSPHGGLPTSWSSELDTLSNSINDEGINRLITVSAGNLRDVNIVADDYLEINDTSEIESPGQSWNSVTVGAYTEKVTITDPDLDGFYPLAPAGDLTPTSRTSQMWRTWPIKPDVVFEGGNRAVDPANNIALAEPDLQLLTTAREHPNPTFTTTAETSAATAYAARFAAHIMAEYPELWPETIRALMINSAEWTQAMRAHLPLRPQKQHFAILLRRYGYGVPNINRALHSARNSLTLLVEDEIQPFHRPDAKKKPKFHEMKTYALPWPQESLEALGDQEVRMRITLSYFIEPNPAEASRNRKQGYASHGLRFAMKLPDETMDEFSRRLNLLARDEEGHIPGPTDGEWVLGQNRNVGSIHSDIWEGPASDLARRGVVAVHPVGGWWRDRPHLERYNDSTRFSLVVSIDAPEVDVDIYTPVANRIAVEII